MKENLITSALRLEVGRVPRIINRKTAIYTQVIPGYEFLS